MTIWLPPGRQLRSRGHWVFRRGCRISVGRPPRTTLEQTVLDLAAVRGADALVTLLAEAVRRGADPGAIRAALDATPRHPRRRLLAELLAETEQGVRSPLERRYLHAVERAHHLPVGARQHSPSGQFDTDVWYVEFHTVVELDGRTWHEGPARFRDHARDNRHAEAGLATLRFGWADTVGQSCAVARRVAAVLRRNGWTGTPRDCPRCVGRRWL